MNRHILFCLLTLLMLVSCTDIDPTIANTPFGMTAIRYEYIIILLSMFAGWALVFGGIVLLLLGLSGQVELIMEGVSFSTRLVNASPGLVMVLVGAYVILKSRLNIRARKDDDKSDDDE